MGLPSGYHLKLLLHDFHPRYKICLIADLKLGHRSCIGRKFAETEMKCLVSVLVANYSFYEVVPGRRVEKESIITVRPKGGMPLRIVRVDH